jgi:NAD(P)-dependent dehydrogenase (short-subunit alcohol dehydrogenase family)
LSAARSSEAGVQYAEALDPIRVNAADPGYTATDLNAHRGTQTVQEGSEIIVRMATIDRTGPTGTYVGRYGTVAW